MKKDTLTFELYLEDYGDFSVGIPAIFGPITVTVPADMIPEEQEGEFEKGIAGFLKTWTDGHILTSWEKAESEAREAEWDRIAQMGEGE